MSRESRLLQTIVSLYNNIRQKSVDSEIVSQALRQELADRKRREISDIEARFASDNQSLENNYTEAMQTVENNLENFRKQLVATWYANWTAPLWQNYHTPPINGRLPALTRIGEFELIEQVASVNTFCTVPIIGSPNGNLIIRASGAAKAQALEAMQAAMFRLITTVPPSKLRFTLIDPVGLGRNMAGFMELPEDLYGSKVWTETRHIEEQLVNLSEHIETVFQKYLQNRFNTMEEYNLAAGEVAEPYRVLVVADFPAKFSDESAQRLISLAKNGPRAGVHCVITVDNDAKLPYNFSWPDLAQAGHLIEHASIITETTQNNSTSRTVTDRFFWQHPNYKDIPLNLDTPPATELFHKIMPLIGQKAKENSKVEAPYPKAKLEPSSWWQGSAAEVLAAEIGKIGANRTQLVELGSGTSHSGLIVGRPGSGKSVLLHAIITSLVTKYSPQELELYLLDFKEVEFKTYATHQLPHARVVAIKVEREFGLSVLQGLDTELKRRMEIFRLNHCVKLSEARQRVQEPLPRILLIADEFQELFTYDDNIARDAITLIDRIVRQGRAFGMHILMASQTLSGSNPLPRATVDQMAVRIALQCSDADSRLIFSDSNDAARLLSRPGEAIYNAANGLIEGNSPFQAFFLPNDKRDECLTNLKTVLNQRQPNFPAKTIIFEGDQLANVMKNSLLTNCLSQNGWPPEQRATSLWVGDPVSIKNVTTLTLRRQSRSNVLVVGQPEETGLACLNSMLISLVAQQAPERARFFFLDLANVDDAWMNLSGSLINNLPHPHSFGNRRQVAQFLEELNQILQERLTNNDLSVKQSIYLFIHGVQRARELISPDGYSQTEEAMKLAAIYRDGPDVGIHSFIWADTYPNLMRVMDRNSLTEFGWRVLMQVSEDASNNLMNSPAASRLGEQRAYAFNDETNAIEKFIPFALTEAAQLEAIARRLTKKTNVVMVP